MPNTLDQTYSQERLKLVLDSTRLGMWDWNPQTNEVLFDQNWATMLGVTVDDLTMTLDDWSSRVHPDDMEKCFQDIQAHLTGETDFYENLHRMRHADGHWVYILDRGRVVEHDENGNPVRFTGTHADVTPLKNAEFQASLAVKSKERFFSAMSHELRAPLHAMLGIVEQVQKQLTEPNLKHKLHTVQDSGRHLMLLIKDILDSAQLQQNAITLRPETFNLGEVIKSIQNLFEFRATEKDIQLTTEISPTETALFIETDQSRLSQILINLVSNAIKYTDAGQVCVRVTEDDSNLIVSVKDTGRGIENIDAIFQPFFTKDFQDRLDDAHSTGLGLTITKELIEIMGLKLNVKSTLGEGSVFSLYIPARFRRDAEKTHKNAHAEEIDIQHWPNASVLVVDDTPVNTELVSMMLEETPLNVETAANAKDALAKLDQQTFDIVVSDLHMPECGGLALSKQIRSNAQYQQPVIIIASADAYNDIWAYCEKAGVNDYLEKPFDENQLLNMIHKHLHK
ncbi:response regulator [Teredinibacter sp. KSP-S5-2]|uniref:hybrid sensor histidine kinase/response regulator n=1 Tax=Teredinibacter sp. KSP-S5-2 TaxID=3034506 RepID=UPI002934E67A|nr:response regulator [Teredinibacter sp. KSP-S5-2]WNO09995.1 response regulator [Teredinibacter sp. KSP-S5-2]